MFRARSIGWIAGLTLLTCCGCSGSRSRVNPPAINPQQAAEQALAEYDTNGDGSIDGAELDKVPAIKSSLTAIDKNGDGKISAAEIQQRIEQWQASKIGLTQFRCTVTLDGAPLAGATVTLVPEKFLGPNVLPATGVTGDQGVAMLSVAEDKRPAPNMTGLQVGFYRVEISKQSAGSETIPARYNVNTELGQEIAQDAPPPNTQTIFNLKSK